MIIEFESLSRSLLNYMLPDSVQIEQHGKQRYFVVGAGFDCETTVTDSHESAFCYIWQFSINENVVYSRKIGDIVPFIKMLSARLSEIELKRSKYKRPKNPARLLVYDANLGYEWAFFRVHFAQIGVTRIFAKSRTQPLLIQVGDYIEMREALGVWGYSLDNIAKTYTKTQKAIGDIDYKLKRNSMTPLSEKEMHYVCNDVLILSELVLIALNKYSGRIPLTGTGIIRDATKTEMKEKGLSIEVEKKKIADLMPINENEYETCFHYLFCGGLSHSSMQAVYDTMSMPYTDIVCADLVSDYPAQMVHRKFPAGKLLRNLAPEEMIKYPHWFCMVTFSNIVTKTGHTLISKHKCIELEGEIIDNGRVWSAQKCSVYCTEIDVENIKKIYTFDEFVICSDCHAFTRSEAAPAHLLDVMSRQYEIKNQLKIEGKSNTVEYAESKKFVNGCFGMCSTRIYTTDVVFSENDLMERKSEKTYAELIKNQWLNPWISVYTTCYARAILCDVISKFPDLVVQYDTDSIYFHVGKKDSPNIVQYLLDYNDTMKEKNHIFFHGNRFFETLGMWEIDKPLKRFKCLGAKRYLKEYANGEIKLVCAGCKPSAFAAYCTINNVDPFSYFNTGMVLESASSLKTTLKYQKERKYETVTDYRGMKENVIIESSAVITDIPFSLHVNPVWLTILQDIVRNDGYL